MKKLLLFAGILVLLLYLLFCPLQALEAAREGLNLWLNTLIPTFLPFVILTNILTGTGMIEKMLNPMKYFWKNVWGISPSGSYALLTGWLCGYPMGAKVTSDLYEVGKISRSEAEYLLTFVNQPSPAFINTYVVNICMKKQVSVGKTFLIIYLSAFITMIIFRYLYISKDVTDSKQTKIETSISSSPGALLDVSIMNGFETITRLGGYILLFSILAAAVKEYWNKGELSCCILLGFMEMTTGIRALSIIPFPTEIKYLCIVPLTVMGGLCVAAQTRSIVSRKLSLHLYYSAKILSATVSVILILIFAKII